VEPVQLAIIALQVLKHVQLLQPQLHVMMVISYLVVHVPLVQEELKLVQLQLLLLLQHVLMDSIWQHLIVYLVVKMLKHVPIS